MTDSVDQKATRAEEQLKIRHSQNRDRRSDSQSEDRLSCMRLSTAADDR